MIISLTLAVTLRRKFYELFQYSHKYIGIVFYVTACIHAPNFWYVLETSSVSHLYSYVLLTPM